MGGKPLKRSWLGLFGLVSVSTVILSGCGSSAPASSSSATSSSTTKSTTSSTTKVNKNVIVDAISEEPANLNPVLGPGMTFSDMVDTALYQNLFNILPSGKLVPQLATKVPSVSNGGISKNGLVYTVYLHKGIKWSNGKPFTAADVITTWKVLVNPKVNAVTTLGYTDITSVKAINKYEVQFTLKKPYAPFLTLWAGCFPAIIPSSVFAKMPASKINTSPWNHKPTAFLGPYMLKSWQSGNAITLVRNPSYWGPKAKTKEIIFKVIPNQNSIFAAMKAHEVNVWYFDPINMLQQIKALPGVTVYLTPAPAWEHVVLNEKTQPAFKNVYVRQALQYAINRKALVQKLWQGQAQLITSAQPPASWASDSNLKPYPYSPSKAKALLKKAGYTMGSNGYLQKNGKTFHVVYSTTSGNPWRKATEQVVQQELKAVGIQMTVKNYDPTTFFGTIVHNGTFQMAEYMSGNGVDPSAIESNFLGSQFAPKGHNASFWNDPTFNKLASQAQSTPSQSARKKLFYQMDKIQAQQMPNLFYYSPKEFDSSYNITGYKPNPWTVDTWNIGSWQVK